MSKATKIEIDTKTFIRFWLVILGFVLTAVLIYKAKTALLIIGAALFLALALSPLIKSISSILPSKSRTLSITLAYTLVIGLIICLVAIVTPTIINESLRFLGNIPELLNENSQSISALNHIGESIGLTNIHERLLLVFNDISSNIIANLGTIITASVSTVASTITALILILVLSLFMLLEGPAIAQTLWQKFKHLDNAKRNANILRAMAKTISKYVSNALSVSLINASCSTFAIFILSFIFHFSPGLALPFGLITGIFSLIPMFGSFVGGCIVALLLAFNSWIAGLIFIIYTIIYLQLESNFISPKIQGKGLKLPALLVLSSVTIGVYMFGLIGAIIAIPITACIKILIEEYTKDFSLDDEK